MKLRISFGTPAQRLAHLILRRFDDSDGHAVDLPNLIEYLSREELAHMVGTVRVVINRLLTGLRRKGIVDNNTGVLRLLNLRKLLKKTEQHVTVYPSRIQHSIDALFR